MAVDLSVSIPAWTDGVDHWRQIDVSWLRDRSVLRLADRTVLGASSANAGQTIFSILDQNLYFSANTGSSYNWKGILGSAKLVVNESAIDPEIRLATGGAGSGISWKAGSTIAVTNLQVSGTATINGALTAASLTSTSTVTAGSNLTVAGSGSIGGNLTVTGSIVAGSITGSSSTAAKLATARTIALIGDASGSTLFDGSANVLITVTIANKTPANSAGFIVQRDGSGGFSAGPITVTGLTIPGTGPVNITPQINGTIFSGTQMQTSGVILAGTDVNVGGRVYASESSVTGDWSTAHFVANGVTGGAASISLRTSPVAAQIRLGSSVNDLYFRNATDTAFITLQAASFVVGSSTRYKDDIKDFDIDALDIVRKLEPKSWHLKDPFDDRRHIGFTAEALDEVFPIAVVLDDEGLPSAIETGALDTLALVAIKQLQRRIEALERKPSNIGPIA